MRAEEEWKSCRARYKTYRTYDLYVGNGAVVAGPYTRPIARPKNLTTELEPTEKFIRRTQAERRATTRAALLDACLACIVEEGYANLTTRGIAQRAGVSQGTQQHYFKTKSEFVVEAMRYASEQLTNAVLKRVDIRDLSDPERQEDLLDEIWAIHKSPAFKASLELWIAARGDDELRKSMRKLERDLTGVTGTAVREAIGDDERGAQLLVLVDIALATVRGYAMLAPVVPQAELERRWTAAKPHLLAHLRTTQGLPAAP